MFAGAAVCEQVGIADVTLARNIALTKVTQLLVKTPERFKTVLMIDDDISWTTEQAQAVIEHSRKTGKASSACYSMKDGRLAAYCHKGKWSVGLGFIAIPAETILQLAKESVAFDYNEQTIYEFTKSGVFNEDGKLRWLGEDYYFTRERLGGIELLPIGVGHSKVVVIQPNVPKLAAFIEETHAASLVQTV